VADDFVAAQARLAFWVSLTNIDPFDMPFDKLGKSGWVLQVRS